VLNRAWGVESAESGFRGFALKRFSAFILIVAVSVILLASMALGTIVLLAGRAMPVSLPIMYIWQLFAPAVLLTLLAAAIFKILPDARMHWKDVWFGAIVTGSMLAISKYFLSLYLSRSTIGSVLGVAGSFGLLLLWLYFSFAVLLFGAELTQVRARQQGRRPQPTENAFRSSHNLPAA
jgi:membrane protein